MEKSSIDSRKEVCLVSLFRCYNIRHVGNVQLSNGFCSVHAPLQKSPERDSALWTNTLDPILCLFSFLIHCL